MLSEKEGPTTTRSLLVVAIPEYWSNYVNAASCSSNSIPLPEPPRSIMREILIEISERVVKEATSAGR